MFDKSNHSPAALDVALKRRREDVKAEAARQAEKLKQRQTSGGMLVGPRAPAPTITPAGIVAC